MNEIGQFLQKFKHLILTRNIPKDIVVSVVKTETGLTLSKDSVRVKNGKVTIDASAGVQTTLFLHREKILSQLKDVSGGSINNLR